MKKLLLLLFILSSLNQLNAQTVNGMPVEDIQAKYVEIVATSKLFSVFKVTVYLDYGQIGKMKEVNKGHILGANGKQMKFNGSIGALNFLSDKGFKYVSQYAVTSGSSNVYHILLENTNFKKE